MTSELRPAVEVWDDAIAAWAADTIDTRQAAAAVIQAYGDEREEKGREEQAAELAKFKALAETLAGYANHKPKCRFDLIAGIQKECDCGLSEALSEYKEARDAS